ncbi:MAG: 2-C-methyl-D-erythritol 4-phosphate cytidylyltransferase [Candidatus Binatia bacterium]|nr:2-C-methyl-D-erythritol 4-phosphate cytidylyltransferase [Candidatus Binatia bacterium]
MVAVVIAAAGQGVRLGAGSPKALKPLAGRPLYLYSLATLRAVSGVGGVWLVVPSAAQETVSAELSKPGEYPFPVQVVAGGAERQESVAKALTALPPETAIVAVHDAARPFASAQLFQSCIAAARFHGAAIAALPASDTVKLVEAGVVRETLDRSRTWLAQTPQVARADWLRIALERAVAAKLLFTDEAGALEHCGYPVHIVRGEEWNRKLTTPEDWKWAEWFALERSFLA